MHFAFGDTSASLGTRQDWTFLSLRFRMSWRDTAGLWLVHIIPNKPAPCNKTSETPTPYTLIVYTTNDLMTHLSCQRWSCKMALTSAKCAVSQVLIVSTKPSTPTSSAGPLRVPKGHFLWATLDFLGHPLSQTASASVHLAWILRLAGHPEKYGSERWFFQSHAAWCFL